MVFIISCGKVDMKHILYPIIPIIILIIRNYFFFKTDVFKNIRIQHFIKVIVISLGKCLAIIPFLIFKKEINHLKGVINPEKLEKNSEKENIQKITKIKKKKKYYIFSLNIIINFAHDILGSYIKLDKQKFYSFWIFDMIFVCILSYFIFNNKLYRHHYFSIIIILILGIIMNIINGKGKKINYNNLLIMLFISILSSFNLVINKYLMDNLLFIEYEICFYEGFSCLILSIIGLIIFTKYNIGNNDDFFEYYDLINTKEIIVIILSSISQLIISLFGLMTIHYYTIFHYFIFFIFNEGDYYSYSLSKWKLYINLILYVLFLFLILVFNENFELNCFGLEKYTKINIIKRANEDYITNSEDNDETNDNDNDSIIEKISDKTIKKKIIEIGRFQFDFSDSEFMEI